MDRKPPGSGGAYVVDQLTNCLMPGIGAVISAPPVSADMSAPAPEPVQAGLMDEEEVY